MKTSTEAPVSVAEARRGLLGVYAPPEALMVAGEGPWLIDESGKRYLDFTCGIGVTALGHGSPEFRSAVQEALVTAQSLREDMREQSRREADLARREAELEAKRMLADADRRIEERHTALAALKVESNA